MILQDSQNFGGFFRCENPHVVTGNRGGISHLSPTPCFRSRNKKGRSVTKVRHQARVLQKVAGCIPKYCRIRMLEYTRFVVQALATAGETIYIDVYNFGDSDWWFILSQEPTMFQKLVYETTLRYAV